LKVAETRQSGGGGGGIILGSMQGCHCLRIFESFSVFQDAESPWKPTLSRKFHKDHQKYLNLIFRLCVPTT